MRLLPSILCMLLALHCAYAPPVSPDKDKDADSEVKQDLEDLMEYHRYLKEVVQALESDPDFRERLEKAGEDDVRSGRIAEQLDFVSHNVRTKLDEIKRRELERLRHLATRQFELTNELDAHGKVPTNEHVDHTNPHTFEIEDLKKLIMKTTSDLEAADEKRRQEFKEYEMQKEYEKHRAMEETDETKKKEIEEKMKKEAEEKKHHKPLHHPGSKPQLEEVWEKQDHMNQQFDPKAFFMMHDVDGNGVWDANEVKALFIKELDKLYGPGGPNKDLHERAEEMERMREHVFKENDKNRDGLIDFHEFMLETQRADFNQDEGWKSIDENEVFTNQEYTEFEKRRLEEMKFLQERGLVDAHGNPLPGAHDKIIQAQQHFRSYYMKQQEQLQAQQALYGQAPQGYPHGQPQFQQIPQGQYPHQQYPQQGYQQFQQNGPGQFQPPQGLPYQQPPQGYQQPPQGYQQPPQGHQQPPQGYQQPPQGHQQPPQGYQQPPQGQYQQPPQVAQPIQTQNQQPSQGQYAQPTHSQNQQPSQGQHQPQAQNFQTPPSQQPPQNLNQGQPQNLNVVPSQGSNQAQVPQGQPPQGQIPQGQVPSPSQIPSQAPSVGLPQNPQVPQSQNQGQSPPVQAVPA